MRFNPRFQFKFLRFIALVNHCSFPFLTINFCKIFKTYFDDFTDYWAKIENIDDTQKKKCFVFYSAPSNRGAGLFTMDQLIYLLAFLRYFNGGSHFILPKARAQLADGDYPLIIEKHEDGKGFDLESNFHMFYVYGKPLPRKES